MSKKLVLIIFIFVVTLFAVGFLSANIPVMKTYTLHSGLCPQRPLKIFFLSDIHHGFFYPLAMVRSVIARTNAENPDIVLLGGDYVYKDIRYIGPVFAELSKLKATYGVYAVLGNHDHWENADITRACMKSAGILCLDNDSLWLDMAGSKLKLMGVGDLWTDEQHVDGALADVVKGDYTILLSHNPDYFETLPDSKRSKIDLLLSGHTHGGQITLFGLWAPFKSTRFGEKYRTGIKKIGETTVIVSNGIGTVFPPLRFFAPPQIVRVILK